MYAPSLCDSRPDRLSTAVAYTEGAAVGASPPQTRDKFFMVSKCLVRTSGIIVNLS